MSRLANTFIRGLTRAGKGMYDRLGPSASGYPVTVYSNGAARSYRVLTDGYAVRDAMLAGSIFNPGRGSYVDSILKVLGKPCQDAAPIVNYYNPVPAIVGCYSHALGGRLGEELALETPSGDPVKARLADAIGRIWKWSGLDTNLEAFTTLAANQGTAGIKVVAEGGDAPRVWLQFVHPSEIVDAIEDGRGNIQGVQLKYTVADDAPLGETSEQLEVIETLDKKRISLVVGGEEQLRGDETTNALGVTPFVLARHSRPPGSFFGQHAYAGSEPAVWSYNWALSQLDEATARAINETVFMAGAGDEPTEIPLGRLTAMYVKLATGVPAPELKYIVPQLAIAETRETIVQNIELLYTRQPELILNALKLLSGTSGETLLQVLRPVEASVLRARVRYEDALIRAMQIALSAGVLMGLWDLGTGTGTKEAADRAFDDGQGPEAFRFQDRPALPETPQQQLVKAQAAVAERQAKFGLANAAPDGASDRERMRLAGYSEDEIDAQQNEDDLVSDEPDDAVQ